MRSAAAVVRWRGHRAGPLLIRQAGQECSRRQGWKMGKRKRPGQAARCALLLWPLVCAGVVVLRRVRPGAYRGRWWSAPRSGAGLLALALIRVQRFRPHLIRLHGLRWRCSIRCVFAVCRRGQILHFTG